MGKVTLPELAAQVFQTIKTNAGVTSRTELNHKFKATSNPATNENLTKVLKSLLVYGYVYKHQDPTTYVVTFWSSDKAPYLGKGDVLTMGSLAQQDNPDYLRQSVNREEPKAQQTQTIQTDLSVKSQKFSGSIRDQLQEVAESFGDTKFSMKDLFTKIDLPNSKNYSKNTLRKKLLALIEKGTVQDAGTEGRRQYYKATASKERLFLTSSPELRIVGVTFHYKGGIDASHTCDAQTVRIELIN